LSDGRTDGRTGVAPCAAAAAIGRRCSWAQNEPIRQGLGRHLRLGATAAAAAAAKLLMLPRHQSTAHICQLNSVLTIAPDVVGKVKFIEDQDERKQSAYTELC